MRYYDPLSRALMGPAAVLGTALDRYYDPNIGQATAATYERVYPKKPTDNIFNSRALWFALGEEGFKQSAPGGRLFESPVEYAENASMAMVGELTQLDTTRYDVFDAARYDIKICAGTVVNSFLEDLMNRGSEAKFELIEGKIENARNSHFALLNRQAWNTSTPGALELTAIPTIISSTPATGTVGGINAALFTWWRNRQNSGAKTTTVYDNLVSAMVTTFNQCSIGGTQMTPTCAIMDRTTFGGFEGRLTSLVRYFKDDRTKSKGGDPGFLNTALSFKTIPVFYDEDHPADRVDFLNNKALAFQYLEGAWAKFDPDVTPANQLARIGKIFTMGNFTSSGRRFLGCVTSTAS